MVQFIPRPKGFGQLMAEGIGQGASAGVGQISEMMQKLTEQKMKQNRLQSLLTPQAQSSSETGSQLQGEMPESQSQHAKRSLQQRIDLALEFPEVARELREQEKRSWKGEKI